MHAVQIPNLYCLAQGKVFNLCSLLAIIIIFMALHADTFHICATPRLLKVSGCATPVLNI